MSLPLAAAALARAAPYQWGEFLKALKEVSDAKARDCVQSPPEVVHVAQGRAQQAASLLAQLTDAVKDADRISERKK